MENLFTKKVPLYFETEESQLILGDSFKMYGAPLPVEVGIIFTRKEPLAGWNRSWSAE